MLSSALRGHDLVAVFLGDTGRLISYARSRIEVYAIQTLERVAEIDTQGEILDIWIAPGQDRLVALTADGSLAEYPIYGSPQALIALARARLDRCLDANERRTFALDPVPPGGASREQGATPTGTPRTGTANGHMTRSNGGNGCSQPTRRVPAVLRYLPSLSNRILISLH